MPDDSSHGTWTFVETMKLGFATSAVVITCCLQVIPGLGGSLFDFELGSGFAKFAHTSVRLKLQGWRGRSLTTVWPPQVHRLHHNPAQCKKVLWLNKSLPLSLISMRVRTMQWWCSCWLEAWILQSQPGHSSNSGRRERLHPPCIDLADINTPTQNVADS